MLREDIEDELSAVDDLQICHSSDVVRLSRTKVAVEDQRLSVELHRSDHDILELAAT
jgi:hypothetical protein